MAAVSMATPPCGGGVSPTIPEATLSNASICEEDMLPTGDRHTAVNTNREID